MKRNRLPMTEPVLAIPRPVGVMEFHAKYQSPLSLEGCEGPRPRPKFVKIHVAIPRMINRRPKMMPPALPPITIRLMPSKTSPPPPQRKRTLSKNDQPRMVSGLVYSCWIGSDDDMISSCIPSWRGNEFWDVKCV